MVTVIEYPKYSCQSCGSTKKLVETVIDDEFIWDKATMRYIPDGFSDKFDHTGEEKCAVCGNDLTGARE